MAYYPRPRGAWGYFNRKWLLDGLRTFLWVAVITLLIWVYADVQFTDQREFSAEVVFHSESAPNLVVLEPSEPVNVRFLVRGNRYLIDRFNDALRQDEHKLRVDAAERLREPGKYSDQWLELLNSLREIKMGGLDVTWAQSEHGRSVDLVLDELRTIKNVPVKFAHNGGELEEAATKLEPDHMDMRVPASRLKNTDVAKLELATQTLDLSQLPAGETVTRTLPIQQPAAVIQGLKLEPVKVTFKLVQKTTPRQFQDVSIQVVTPKSWEDDNTWSIYKLDSPAGENWTRTITVTGNQIDLEKLRKEDIQAYILLNEADKAGSLGLGKVVVHLPPELKVQLASDPIAPVQYRLIKRGEATPAR